MSQINWRQVNAHLVYALHAMQTGWGKVRDYVTRVEEPEWEFDPNWSPTMPTPEQAQKAQAFWDEVMEGVEAGLENHAANDDTDYWAGNGIPLIRSDDPLAYDAYHGRKY